MKRFLIGLTTLAFSIMPALGGTAAAAAPSTFAVTPWTFDPDGLCPGITSEWTGSTGNPSPALHLTKPCLTAVNASSEASLKGVSGITLTELNFDYRSDGHCGAGAPRFNVQASDGFHFIGGCANGTVTDLGNNWKHVTFDPTNPAQAFPAMAPDATVTSIDIVFDEGTDSAGGTAGSVYLDNISVNNMVVGSPHRAKSFDDCKNNGWKLLQNDNDKSFKNQGQCVSWFNHHDGNGQDDNNANGARF